MKRIFKLSLFSIAFEFLVFGSAIVWAERLAVSESIAYIRSGPGTKYGILWKADRFYPLWVLEKSGGWLHFSNYEGEDGWIHRSFVDKIPTVITQKKRCNIRGGPGPYHKILATVGKGLSFRIIKRKDPWINIQHADGFIGWIHNSLVW